MKAVKSPSVMLPGDHEAAAQQQDDHRGRIGGERDRRDQRGHDAQDAEPHVLRLRIRGNEFLILHFAAS